MKYFFCMKSKMGGIVALGIFIALAGCGSAGTGTPLTTLPTSGGLTSPTPTAGALSWSQPTDTTGGAFTEIAGYKVYYGTSSGTYTGSIDVGNTISVQTLNIPAGTYYVAVKAYDSLGRESDFSSEAIKIVN